MWNFTVRGVIIPNCEDIQQLLDQECQAPLTSLKAEDLFIGMYIQIAVVEIHYFSNTPPIYNISYKYDYPLLFTISYS